MSVALSWQDFKSSSLENQYNPRAALGAKTSSILSEWEAKSVLARKDLELIQDIPYGDHDLQKFDYCKSSSEQPTIILLHGGYWRALDKAILDWHVKQLFEHGLTVYNVNRSALTHCQMMRWIKALSANISPCTSPSNNEIIAIIKTRTILGIP